MIVCTSKSPSQIVVSERFIDEQRVKGVIDVFGQVSMTSLDKQASTGGTEVNDTVKAVIEALASMGIKANIDIGELIKKICSSSLKKEAKSKDDIQQDIIKIASKRIEDSHYDMDIAKNRITKSGKSIILVSFYMREAYLGRYLIKRNYYFVGDNDDDAEYIYNDLVTKAKRTRGRYYQEKIGINDIFPEVKAFLDGTKGDLELDFDRAGTTPVRNKTTGHEAYGPSNIRAAKK